MKNLLISLSFAVISVSNLNAQTNYHSPLGIPLVLSSNFGELRPNHFHMGVDFKTNLKTGYRLYAIEEGFVSRIKVSPYGYGKVVYIDHPNGMTSVYAHISEFKGAVDSIVKLTQEKEQNFEVEIFPKKDEIKVERGEVFALSGNSGSSTAPHLHFEIRETITEHALNPLMFGFDIADNKEPELRGVKLYSITKNGYRFPGKELTKLIVKGKYGYYIGGDAIEVPANYLTQSGGLGLAFDVIDRLDGASNQCGLYGSYLIIDGDTLFSQAIDRIPFESTRYVNCHKDYEAYNSLRRKYHKSFKTTENDLPIYGSYGNGLINAKPGQELNVEYIAFDVKGNQSSIKFTLKIAAGEMSNEDVLFTTKNQLHPQEEYTYSSESAQLEFPKKSVYEPIELNWAKLDYSILSPSTPVNVPFTIKCKVKGELDGKHYFEVATGGSNRALEIKYEDNWAVAESKYYGPYSLKRDETGPTVYPVNFTNSTTFISKSTLVWKITDRGIGIKDYDLFIDDQWHLLEYESKGDYITFSIPANFSGTKNIRIIATDACGNDTKWEKEVTFK